MEKDNEQRKSFDPSKDWRPCLGEQGFDEHDDDDDEEHDNDNNFYDGDDDGFDDE